MSAVNPKLSEYCKCGRKKVAEDDKFKNGSWKKECIVCRTRRMSMRVQYRFLHIIIVSYLMV